MATQPQYAATPRIAYANISAANSGRDGTGTITEVMAAGTAGTKVERIIVQATGTTTGGMVRLFLHDGTNSRLWREVPVTAITASGTVAAFAAEVSTSPYFVLPNGWSIRAATHNAEAFVVIAMGADI